MKEKLFAVIPSGATVAVAVSGGGDSMALLHYLAAHEKEGQYRVIALNVEHGIRGETSLRDSAFVREYCEARGVPLLFYAVQAREEAARRGVGLEEAARTLRYACFRKALEGRCDYVALAHHADDQAETVLLNLLRGAGLRGAGGMPPERDRLLRPFLHVTRAEIEAYLNEHAVPHVTDETNFSQEYKRNALRLSVMPQIKELFPAGTHALVRFAEICREADALLYALAEKELICRDDAVLIPLTLSAALLPYAALAAERAIGRARDYAKTEVDAIVGLIDAENGASICLGDGYRAAREYDVIAIYRPTGEPLAEYPFGVRSFGFGKAVLTIERVPQREAGALCADCGKIPSGAIFRARREGDVFTPYGGGTRKLKEYFIDRKVPARRRDGIPVLANGNTVLFVAGMEISDLIKVDNSTRDVIKLTYIE